ncbi:hypothetical protein [Legionella sp. PC997]|uniref:hypothetical protein n=1 Tax=Legionella sp. PC997 TaxID=2755562 RepID=UPI0015F7EAF3|nr:hypothetical protein [Legionella sp. PC997]QMT60297.1 hypothetical protein HBNCFIEN_01669 [Legionella sp. PC997]
MDITDQNSVLSTAQQVHEQLQRKLLWRLINNAGVAVVGPLIEISIEEFSCQLEDMLLNKFK